MKYENYDLLFENKISFSFSSGGWIYHRTSNSKSDASAKVCSPEKIEKEDSIQSFPEMFGKIRFSVSFGLF